MSISLNFTAFYMAAIYGGAVAYKSTDSTVLAVLTALASGLAGFGVYLFTPLPSTNGGMFAPPARKQKWGLTTEPVKDHDEPTMRERMSQNLTGINWAKESDDE